MLPSAPPAATQLVPLAEDAAAGEVVITPPRPIQPDQLPE
jgi:hypothetical protein